MGMNYYVYINTCPTCGRPAETIHLGKSSAGWRFTIQANGYKYYKTWEQMKKWLKSKTIFNEDEERVEVETFIKLVEDKQFENDLWVKALLSGEKLMEGLKFIKGYKFYDTMFS
jgi:hypothetical protein